MVLQLQAIGCLARRHHVFEDNDVLKLVLDLLPHRNNGPVLFLRMQQESTREILASDGTVMKQNTDLPPNAFSSEMTSSRRRSSRISNRDAEMPP
jgi:hypothetical protein